MASIQSDERSLYSRTSTEPTENGSSSPERNETEESQLAATQANTLVAPPRKRLLLLEIPTFLTFFAIFLSGTVHKNVLLYQTCKAVYHYSETDCYPLLGIAASTNSSKEIEDLVQPYVSKILMAQSLLGSIGPAIISLFIGPWSDKFGRRPVFLMAYSGAATSTIITLILVSISTVTLMNPWIYLISVIPDFLTGGANIVSNCYISDVTPDEDKPRRLFYNELAMGIGLVIGNIGSSYLLAATNYLTVFAVSTSMLLLALLYIVLFIRESLRVEQMDARSKIREFFRLGLVKDLIKSCLARRPNNERAIIWVSSFSMLLYMFVLSGESNVFYLFLRKKFDVSLREFSFFTSTGIVAKMFGCMVGIVVLQKLFKLSMIAVASIVVCGSVLESSIRAAAQHWWEMYLAMGFGSIAAVSGIMVQSMLTTILSPTELGKIFAFSSSVTTLICLGATPLYTTVYNATLSSYPGAFNIISVILYTISFSLLCYVWSLWRSYPKKAVAPNSVQT